MRARRATAKDLKALHGRLCFQRAFPGSRTESAGAHHDLVEFKDTLNRLTRAEREKLDDTGFGGTRLYYRFSFDVARWLARKAPGAVSIDWSELEDEARLEELLRHVLQPAEDEYFDSGYVSAREWIDLACSGSPGTDFDWLMAQMNDERFRAVWAQLYDAVDLPLVWDLGGSEYSKSKNVFPVRSVGIRGEKMRGRPVQVKKEIQRPVETIEKLSQQRGANLIDVAMASLAVRHRETYHFNHANPAEVYVADVGQGVAVAVFGLLPGSRFPLECTMGFLLLSNGVPIGYGGSSVLFRQVNNGINIFDEYRGSEASFLWVQVMRVYHALTACTRFIANPYQFGGDNAEALKSGAFWFYYHLGYRPVDRAVRQLASAELARRKKNPAYRSNPKTLRRLASCDMHLVLPGARSSDLFDEEWLSTSSHLATVVLSEAGGKTRDEAAAKVARKIARDLGMRQTGCWSTDQKHAFSAIAPFIAAVHPARWSVEEKRRMRDIVRAKGGKSEAHYARLLSDHGQFLAELRTACRRAEQ